MKKLFLLILLLISCGKQDEEPECSQYNAVIETDHGSYKAFTIFNLNGECVYFMEACENKELYVCGVQKIKSINR